MVCILLPINCLHERAYCCDAVNSSVELYFDFLRCSRKLLVLVGQHNRQTCKLIDSLLTGLSITLQVCLAYVDSCTCPGYTPQQNLLLHSFFNFFSSPNCIGLPLLVAFDLFGTLFTSKTRALLLVRFWKFISLLIARSSHLTYGCPQTFSQFYHRKYQSQASQVLPLNYFSWNDVER